MNDSQYSPLPPASDDGDRDSSPHSQLLPGAHINYHKVSTTYSVTFNPLVALRILSTILALVTFIILAIDGDEEFIAADIFLMSMLIVNLLMIVHYFASHVLKVTVELRQQSWKRDVPKTTPKVSMYFDVGLAVITLLCLIIGNSVKRGWGGSAWRSAVVIGYIVVLMQVLLAVPMLDKKNLTLTAKFSDAQGKAPEDTKIPTVVDETERGSARRRATESEEPRQASEDLV